METRTAAEALGLLGLARRAGGVAAGTQRAREALRSGHARLVLVAEDASRVQLRKIEGVMHSKRVPRVVLGNRVVLGAAVGEPPLSAVAVTDPRFSEQLLRRLVASAPTDLE